MMSDMQRVKVPIPEPKQVDTGTVIREMIEGVNAQFEEFYEKNKALLDSGRYEIGTEQQPIPVLGGYGFTINFFIKERGNDD